MGCDISLLPLIADDGSPNRNAVAYEWKARKTLPTSALANIAAIKLVIGRALLYTILDYKKWSARDGGPVLDKAVVQPGFCYFISGTPFAYKLNGDKVFELFCPSPSFQTPEALEKLKDTFRKIDPQQLKENDLQPAVEFLLSPATASGSP